VANRLLVSVNDSATGQVVWAQLHDHAILRENADVVLAHLARDVGEYFVSVGQLNAKHCVGQSFDHCAFDLDDTVFFGHCLFVAKSVIAGLRGLVSRGLRSSPKERGHGKIPA
jgi:acid phosphatase class B